MKIVAINTPWSDFWRFEAEEYPRQGFEFEVLECETPEELAHGVRDADAILYAGAPPLLSGGVIAELERCKVIAKYAVGLEDIDIEAASARGIYVVNDPEYCTEEVATHALLLLLACNRKLPLYIREVMEGRWGDPLAGRPIHRLTGQKLGLYGFGRIARCLAVKAKSLGLEIMAYDPYISLDTFELLSVKCVSFQELLRESDILSIHVPLTPETEHSIGMKEIRLMKQGAIIINTSRGAVLDYEALYVALTDGHIATAGLDVFDPEPPPRSHPIFKLPNVIVTPHVAAYSEEAAAERAKNITQDVLLILQGKRPLRAVNVRQIFKKGGGNYDAE